MKNSPSWRAWDITRGWRRSKKKNTAKNGRPLQRSSPVGAAKSGLNGEDRSPGTIIEEVAIVFQYGSNCSDSQMNSPERLCGDARFVDIAETVDDFELAFDVLSTRRGCAASNLVRRPGAKAWGVLYEIPDYLISRETAKLRGRKSFDAIEGEGANYKRETIQVRRPGGQPLPALTYTVIDPQPNLTTDLAYVEHIVTGLRERGVPASYIENVKAIAAANNPEIAHQVADL